jgi:hypothetical protein
MARISVAWQGWAGAPGVTQLYMDPVAALQGPVDAVRTFFAAVAGLIPSGITFTVPNSGDLIEAVDGKISGSWSSPTAPLLVTASGTGTYAGNAGAVVHWLTQRVVDGRRLRGRTFLVPLAGAAYDSTGSLATAANTTFSNAATALVTNAGGSMLVWNRPRKGTPLVPARVGSSGVVFSARVPDLAVSLRSRRI